MKLRECPFCGGKAQIRYIGNGSGYLGYTSNIVMRSKPGFVMCLKCEVTTSRHNRVCRAIDKWNKRVGDDLMERMEDDA
jgi:Lar family restriction alleviation protein